MELKCGKTGNDGHGAMRQCIMPDGHEQDADPRNHRHLFRGKVNDITLRYEDSGVLESAISDDLIGDIEERINDDERYCYSREKIRAALWALLDRKVDELVYELGEYWEKLSSTEQERLLGEPDRDRKQEQAEEYGDYRSDVARGN